MRNLLLGMAIPCLLVAPGVTQSLRSVTDKQRGFKVKVPRFVKETPNQPDEEQIIAKFKGTKKIKPPKGRIYTDRRTGKRVKTIPVSLEVWVFRIQNPGTSGKAATTSGRSRPKPARESVGVGESIKRRKNSGRTVRDFLRYRIPRTIGMPASGEDTDWRDKNKNRFQAFVATQSGKPVQCYAVEHRDRHHGHEIFGIVFVSPRMDAFQKLVAPCVKSLQRIESVGGSPNAEDPYENSDLREIDKRRAIRDRLVKGWYAEDTENFILVTDMPRGPTNLRLLRDMLTDLEVMRVAFEKRFPPIQPLKVVSTVRVCNSYEGYLRYSSKPGTGGYWHPLAEELVLFNPVGKIKKQAWMRKVSPKAILYHEAMHQYFHYANGEMPPASWFNEGYGEYFGGAVINRYTKQIKSIGKNDFRWQVIKKAKRDKKWPLIEKMLPMSQREFYSRKSKDYPVLNNYAFAWAFCYFLEEQRNSKNGNAEWAALPDQYLANLRKATAQYTSKFKDMPKGGVLRFIGPVQKAAYKATFANVNFSKLQADWVAAMKSWK